jgi:tetratricopeptide (TPR) repeat protein
MSMLLADDPRFHPAMQLIDNAEYAEALRQLDALLDQLGSAERVVALYWKVRCLTSLGELPQARFWLEQALTQVDAANPLRICLELQNAYLLYAEKGPERAVTEMRALLDRYGAELKTADFFWIYVQAKTDLGNCLVLAGRYSEAVKELEEALSLQDQPLSRYYIYFWLGIACHHLGGLDKARGYLEHAIAEARSAPEAGIPERDAARLRYELALIAYKQRRYDDAAHHLEFASSVAIQDDPELQRVIKQLKDLVDQAVS